MGGKTLFAILLGAVVSCTSAPRDEEIAELRKQLERAENAAAEAKAIALAALERAAVAERIAAEQSALAEKLTAERAAAERLALAARERAEASRKAAGEAAARARAKAESDPAYALSLYEQAEALEREGKGPEAVRAYVRAARSGSAKAALRLGEIYDKGIPGVSRDYALSLRWYNAARVLGEDVPKARTP